MGNDYTTLAAGVRKAALIAICIANVALLSLGACSDYSPAPITDKTASVTDPAGDTFGTGTTKWDLSGMSLSNDASDLTVILDFTTNVISPTSGDTTAMIGFVDLDVDQDSSTGLHNTIDSFRPQGSGSTELGADYQLILKNYDSDSTIAVSDSNGTHVGRVKPIFDGKRITIHVPLALLGNDDGRVNAAAIVGNVHQPSDFVPNAKHLSLNTSSR